MEILIFFVLQWYLSLFCQSFFHHRYSAHGMFTMSRAWEKVFFYISFVTQGSSYLSPYAYGIMHRLHHAHADTEEDPPFSEIRQKRVHDDVALQNGLYQHLQR